MPVIKKVLKGSSAPKIVETLGLPDLPTEAITDTNFLRTLIVAPPGWGKTEWAMSNPDALLLAFQEGHQLTKGFKIIVDCWDGKLANNELIPYKDKHGIIHMSMRQVVAKLQTDNRFKMIILDTVDDMVKMLLDFKLGKAGVQHCEEMGAYGVGYDLAQNTPFRQTLTKIIKTGRGIVATTHESVENKTFKKGNFAKKETTLPRGIYRQIFSQFDLILHGIYGKKIKGKSRRTRIIQTEGSEDILAKNRYGVMPPAFIVPEKFEDRWKQFLGFLKNPETKDKAFAEFEKAGYELE